MMVRQEGTEGEIEETITEEERTDTKLKFSFHLGKGRNWLIIYFQIHPCIETEEEKKTFAFNFNILKAFLTLTYAQAFINN